MHDSNPNTNGNSLPELLLNLKEKETEINSIKEMKKKKMHSKLLYKLKIADQKNLKWIQYVYLIVFNKMRARLICTVIDFIALNLCIGAV